MKSCLLRRDQMRFPKTVPLLHFTVVSKLNLRESPLVLLQRKERINYNQRLQHILTHVLFANVGGKATFFTETMTIGILQKLHIHSTSAWERVYIQSRLLTFCLVKLCRSWAIPDNTTQSNLEVPLKSESDTVPGQLQHGKMAPTPFSHQLLCDLL